jgi:hypothetical protein
VAACSKPAEKPKAPPTVAAVVELPARKAGLWEQTMSRDGKPAMGPMGGKISLCLDAASAKSMTVFGREMNNEMCKQQTLTRGLDGSYAFTSTCTLPVMGKMVSKGSASGDFSSKYVVHTETDITGAPMERANGHHVMDVTAEWKGPCPSDMKPGDVVMGNGYKVNMGDLVDRPHGRDEQGAAAGQ